MELTSATKLVLAIVVVLIILMIYLFDETNHTSKKFRPLSLQVLAWTAIVLSCVLIMR